jgi:hypothetical protein
LTRLFHLRVIVVSEMPTLIASSPLVAQGSIRPELADQAKDGSNTRCRARTTTRSSPIVGDDLAGLDHL